METITCGSWIGQLGKALAPRELEALLWVAQGLTTKEIARQMAVSPGTVANRIEAALFKLEAGRRIEAVTKAMRQQIISPLCIALAGLIAMHSVINDSDPMRRDRRAPERRTAQVRIVRKAEAFELHARPTEDQPMQAAIQQSQDKLEALRQEVITATEAFRAKSRFFVTQSGNGWIVVSSSNNRVYGRNTSYPQAVRYAESLERAIDAKTLPVVAVVKVRQIGESATRWVALFALTLILLAGAASS